MTLDEVKHRVFLIGQVARGERSTPVKDAWAHACEDELHVNVLRAIAAGCEFPRELARAALETLAFEFSRLKE
jgi:hypothetical protein